MIIIILDNFWVELSMIFDPGGPWVWRLNSKSRRRPKLSFHHCGHFQAESWERRNHFGISQFECFKQPWSTSSLKHVLSWSSYRECSRQGNVNTAFNLEDDDGKWQPDVWHLCLKSVYSKPKLIKPNPLQLTNVFWGFCEHKKCTAPPHLFGTEKKNTIRDWGSFAQ